MKPSHELFNLIKSLTKSEKRFFKLTSTLQSGEKNYLKIFDAIEKQQVYDEEALKKQFEGERFIRHLPSEKNHLYKLILKSLRSFYSDNSVSAVLRTEIKNIEILYRKALYKECTKYLIKAKKTARDHEKFYYWFELLQLEKMLLEEAFEEGIFNQSIDELIEEEKEVIAKLRNLAEYHVLYSKVNYAFRSSGHVRSEKAARTIEEISEHPLIKGKNTALSKRAATICFYTQGFCHLASNNDDQAFIAFMHVKRIFDSNPLLKKDLFQRYLRTIYNLMVIHIKRNEFRKGFALIDEMKSFKNTGEFNSIDIELMIFRVTYMSELVMYNRLGEYGKAEMLMKEIEVQLNRFGQKLNKEHFLNFYLMFAVTEFSAGKHNKALIWINNILNINEKQLRQDLFTYARLFFIVIHFELGNHDLIDYLIKSTGRFLVRQKRDFPLEKTVLAYMRKLNRNHANPVIRKNILIEFRNELEILIRKPENQVILFYFDFLSWLDSQINQVPFYTAVQQRNL